MWASAPTGVTGTRRPGKHTGPPLIPSCRGRRPRRPAFTARPAPAEKGGKGIRALPGPKVSPRAPRFIKATTRECQLSLAGGRRYALARTDPPQRFFLLDRPLRSRWRLCRLRMRRTPCGCGPFVSGLSAAAFAAVGLRHAPAGAVFLSRTKRKWGVEMPSHHHGCISQATTGRPYIRAAKRRIAAGNPASRPIRTPLFFPTPVVKKRIALHHAVIQLPLLLRRSAEAPLKLRVGGEYDHPPLGGQPPDGPAESPV